VPQWSPNEDLQQAKRDELRDLSEVEVLAKVQAVEDSAAGPSEIRATREAALDRLSDPDLRQATEHFLTQFGHLTDPNPRSMKRLLNAYRYQRDLRVWTSNQIVGEHRPPQLDDCPERQLLAPRLGTASLGGLPPRPLGTKRKYQLQHPLLGSSGKTPGLPPFNDSPALRLAAAGCCRPAVSSHSR
jgi:hypothetical protein